MEQQRIVDDDGKQTPRRSSFTHRDHRVRAATAWLIPNKCTIKVAIAKKSKLDATFSLFLRPKRYYRVWRLHQARCGIVQTAERTRGKSSSIFVIVIHWDQCWSGIKGERHINPIENVTWTPRRADPLILLGVDTQIVTFPIRRPNRSTRSPSHEGIHWFRSGPRSGV